jgi:hypothetical protein
MKNGLKWNKSGVMQREANRDPFFTRLDWRHNLVTVAAPNLSTCYIKRGVRPHAVKKRSSWETLAPTFPLTDLGAPASVWRPPPTTSYPMPVPGQCQYRPQGRTDLLRRQTQEAGARTTTSMTEKLPLGHGTSSWYAFISVLDLVWQSWRSCSCDKLLQKVLPEIISQNDGRVIL